MKSLLAAIATGNRRQVATELDREPALVRKAQVLGAACRTLRREVIELLLDRGADPNAVWRNYRPLHTVIQEDPHGASDAAPERGACLDVLLARGADPELGGGWPSARALLTAAFAGSGELCERLLAAGAVADLHTEAALGRAAAVRRRLRGEPALARGTDAHGLTALQCAAGSRLGRGDARVARGLVESAELLLDAGADPNASVRSWSHDVDVAYFAISAENAEATALLLARGASADAALPSAVWKARFDLAELALAHGASADRAVWEGKPLLNQLVRWGQFRQAFWLLERGASPNRSDERGWSAVHQAVSRGNARAVAAVLAAGGDPNAASASGATPLDLARALAREEITALLEGAALARPVRCARGGRAAAKPARPKPGASRRKGSR